MVVWNFGNNGQQVEMLLNNLFLTVPFICKIDRCIMWKHTHTFSAFTLAQGKVFMYTCEFCYKRKSQWNLNIYKYHTRNKVLITKGNECTCVSAHSLTHLQTRFICKISVFVYNLLYRIKPNAGFQYFALISSSPPPLPPFFFFFSFNFIIIILFHSLFSCCYCCQNWERKLMWSKSVVFCKWVGVAAHCANNPHTKMTWF